MYIRKFLIVSYIVSVIIGICFLYYDDLLEVIEIKEENRLLEIYIPRIKLKRNVYNIDSSLNNVDSNIEILDNSNLDKDLYFLASHSGSSKSSYFDDLVYLEKGDFIRVGNKEGMMVFVVWEMEYIDKNGYFDVSYSSKGNELFLITCSLKYVNRQLVVRAKLIYKG